MVVVAAGEEKDAAPSSDEQVREKVVRQDKVADYFKIRPLPWWVCFLGSIFLLTKFQLVYNDSPCAVLGTQSPVTMSDVKRAFRTLSMCTHPDRLRGRLKRQATPAEARRGEIIFNRASMAKDELTKSLRGKKQAACYQGELEMAIFQVLKEVGEALASLGIKDYFDFAYEMVISVVTLKKGVVQTLFHCLWLAFLFRLFKQFIMYLWGMGLLRGSISFVMAIVIGPFPTLFRFLLLPIMRVSAFGKELFAGPRSEAPAAEDTSATPAATPAEILAAKAVNKVGDARIKQRKKKETDEEREKKGQEMLQGSPGSGKKKDEPTFGQAEVPQAVWECVTWSHAAPVKGRAAAATAVQFDLLLILTKPIVPLIFLVSLGQVWNGLFSSLFIGHALRRWVPQMSYEAHHLLCAFFGAVHTLLGVSAQQVEDFANQNQAAVLHLVWNWSFKDVLSIVHMAMLGATMMPMSQLGNDPSYAASFGSGLALRMFFARDSVRGFGLVQNLAGKFEASLRDLNIVFDSAEEAVAFAGNGIADCGGGPFRMLFGDRLAGWMAVALKCWLALLPALAMLQWFHRMLHAAKNLGKKFKTTRFVQRLLLFCLGLVQISMLFLVELNASNGALGNFWVAMLFGCVGESLLCTFDIRGPVRQVFFLLIFLLV